MRVIVEVLGSLRRHVTEEQNPGVIELDAGSTVDDALRVVGVPPEALWNASIGGSLVYRDRILEDGESLLVFTPIGGGSG